MHQHRVYDYDRRDKNGNARELHIEKALDVTTLAPAKEYKAENEKMLAKCKYFTVEKLCLNGTEEIVLSEDSFRSIIVLSGKGKLKVGEKELEIIKGDSIFIPAQNGMARVEGELEAIISYV